jgi:hypothetical protein
LALIAGRDFGLILMNPENQQPLAFLETGIPICFSPDNTMLLTIGPDRILQIWNLGLIRHRLNRMRLDWELPPLPLPATFSSRKVTPPTGSGG